MDAVVKVPKCDVLDVIAGLRGRIIEVRMQPESYPEYWTVLSYELDGHLCTTCFRSMRTADGFVHAIDRGEVVDVALTGSSLDQC